MRGSAVTLATSTSVLLVISVLVLHSKAPLYDRVGVPAMSAPVRRGAVADARFG